jgi:hypothetical protein
MVYKHPPPKKKKEKKEKKNKGLGKIIKFVYQFFMESSSPKVFGTIKIITKEGFIFNAEKYINI